MKNRTFIWHKIVGPRKKIEKMKTTYMIIENYKLGKTEEIYHRFSEHGRMLPSGVYSWVEVNLTKCYQIMKSESLEKLYEWIDNWKDLVEFDVIPVINSEEASKIAIQK
jgi:hypothetical protein